MLFRPLALVVLLVVPGSAAGAPPDVTPVADRFAARWSAVLGQVPRIRAGSIVAATRCGGEFLALHTELPAGDERHVVALFNAAVCHDVAGLWSESATEYRRLIDRWPDHARAELSVLALARGHLAVANFAEARALAVLDRLETRLLRDNPPVAASMFWRRGDLMRTDLEDRRRDPPGAVGRVPRGVAAAGRGASRAARAAARRRLLRDDARAGGPAV